MAKSGLPLAGVLVRERPGQIMATQLENAAKPFLRAG